MLGAGIKYAVCGSRWGGMCGPLEMGRERMEIATGGVVQRWGQDWEIGF